MLTGRAAIFISYSEASKSTVAIPFSEYLGSLGLYGILVGEEPMPEAAGDWDPDAKVAYFLDRSDMFVALVTADVEPQDGQANPRPNIIDEIRSARQRPHLKSRMQIFKASNVALPSNINPTYESLNPDEVGATFSAFERQARAYGILGPERIEVGPEGTSPPEPDSDSRNADDGEAAHQAINALERLAVLLRGEESSELGSIAARAHLASSAALATQRSADLLGVHEINGLYRERTSVVPTASEISHLLRTIVANIGAANAPGWYWLRAIPPSEVQSRLVTLAIGDSDSSARRTAIELLTYSPNRPTSSELRSVVKSALAAGDDSMGPKALKLLREHGTRRDLRVLREALEDYSDTKQVLQTQMLVVAREAPRIALQHALDNPVSLDADAEQHLLQAAMTIPEAAVRRALESPSPTLRKLGLRLRHSTSKLRKVDVDGIIANDPEGSVRGLAADLAIKRRWRLTKEQLDAALEKSGWEFDPEVQLNVEFWALRPAEELLRKLDWFGIDSTYIYEALSRKHFEAIQGRITSDLDSDFAELRERTREQLEEAFRRATAANIERKFGVGALREREAEVEELVSAALDKELRKREDLEKFILKRFRIAALAGLAENGTDRHLPLARRFVDDGDRNLAKSSIKLIARVGNDTDVPALLSVAARSWGDIQKLAAEAAINLAADPTQTALELLDIPRFDVVEVALSVLTNAPLNRVFDSIWNLLRDDHLSVRIAAADYFINRLSPDQLRGLPDAYATGQYYYNVMVQVDRELYAPAWIKHSSKAILGS